MGEPGEVGVVGVHLALVLDGVGSQLDNVEVFDEIRGMTDLTRTRWRKSSRSGGNNGQCVELADLGQALAVRDSKCPTGGTLIVGARSRASFITGVKTGRFDA